MTDEEKKIRYSNIVYRLNIINSKINNLNSNIKQLNNTVKNNFSLNDKGLEEEAIDKVITLVESTSTSIKGTIIPSLNNKIYN